MTNEYDKEFDSGFDDDRFDLLLKRISKAEEELKGNDLSYLDRVKVEEGLSSDKVRLRNFRIEECEVNLAYWKRQIDGGNLDEHGKWNANEQIRRLSERVEKLKDEESVTTTAGRVPDRDEKSAREESPKEMVARLIDENASLKAVGMKELLTRELDFAFSELTLAKLGELIRQPGEVDNHEANKKRGKDYRNKAKRN